MKRFSAISLLLCCLPLMGQYLVPHGPRGGFFPDDLANLLLWLKTDAGVLTDAFGVFEWQDQSGNGNDVVQATDSRKPALTAAYQNGLDAITGDGVNDFLAHATSATFPGTGFSLFLVLGAVQNAFVAGGPSGSDNLIQRNNPSKTRIKESGTGLIFDAGSWPTADATLVEFHATGSATVSFVNGTQVGSLGTSDDFVWATMLSFNKGDGESVANWCEWVGYSVEITGTDRTDVRTYLNDKWAIF